jgi:serine/threonine-protein kinase
MPLSSGTRLGPHEILATLGAGGMGEVYRARDTKLGRDVALKILPDSFASDPERVTRFRREAQVLASLNHPHIAAIHGLDEANGCQFLVLEFVEGETLAHRIAKGPIAVDEALVTARQIAEALEAAHDKGIIHRDLKPLNIALTVQNQVKVLDFGLAKVLEPVIPLDPSRSPTLTSGATAAGVILGTAAYMAPEQARGKAVDRRTDIWAFGCVVYEMLAGRPAFDGETTSDIVANIVKNEPDWSALPGETPSPVRSLLRRCLQKDPNRRLQHAGDARIEIDEVIAEPRASLPAAIAAAGRPARWLRTVPWVGAVIAVIVIAALVRQVASRRPGAAKSAVVRLEMNLPAGVELYTTTGHSVAVSPDGTRIAFVGMTGGSRQIFVRSLDDFEATPIRGTENASACFFSPDGRSVGFITATSLLRRVSLADGLVVTVVPDASFLYGAAWGSDDRIVFVRSGALWQVSASGDAPRQLTTLDAIRRETFQAWPTVLPGGQGILFVSASGGTTDALRIESVAVTTGERRVLIERGTLPQYGSTGHLIFFRGGELLAAPFDAARLQVTGLPVRVIGNLPASSGGIPLMNVSASGTLVYTPTTATGRLVWVSRQGVEQPLIDTLRSYTNPRLAQDGSRILVNAGDLWIQDLPRATFTRLTSGEGAPNASFPIWTPDGRRVVFRTASGLRWLDVDGSGRGGAIPETSESDFPGSISPDGRAVVAVRASADTSFDLYLVPLGGDAKPTPIVKTPAYEGGGRLSPDGRWMAYVSDETGQMEVYLRPFPGPDRKWQVSALGGTQPVWNPSGKEIFYRNVNKMMVVAVSTSPNVTLSEPRLLFEQRYTFGAGITIPNYDISPDGQRFVMVKEESNANRLNIVLNWFEELKRRVPAGK